MRASLLWFSFAALSALTIPIVAAGCSSPLGDFDERVCLSGTALVRPIDADFIAVRKIPLSGGPPATVFSWGKACSKAGVVADCLQQLAALPIDQPLTNDAENGYDVSFTRGDEVGRMAFGASLTNLLGSIDTPLEAFMVAFFEGERIPCGRDNLRREDTSFVFLARGNVGCGGVEDHEVTVDVDGNVSRGESVTVHEEEGECFDGL